MSNVLILGASGQIARYAIELFLNETDVQLSLYLRNSSRLNHLDSDRVRVIEGDVLDFEALKKAMVGQDVVYANLNGDLEEQAKNIVEAMGATGVKRLIFITSLGIYEEIPGEFGEWNKRTIGQYLGPYRKSVDIIEASDLDYTVLRAAWLTDYDEIDYEITQKNEPFKGTEVSRKSVAALVVKLAESPELEVRRNLGVNKPNTEGDRLAFEPEI
ncbi:MULTISPECIES: SDR family oxidoreductase [Paenibacillus]|uniref:SDR family oxidoreductase n=1 Tax=Paenibacillus TaxID=44249 RepID=UPI0007BFC5B3|nr:MULTISPECIES: SDR family oxidoreductase [Paenibacillus]WDQ31026.1 SDR family oxidoreductase [Paenibacillus marchantiae]SDK42129.1 NAD(P)H-binding [Paenibacillus sp. OK060]SHN59259.1 NAD(P)H-binding [Paenibacillus sp. ov031]